MSDLILPIAGAGDIKISESCEWKTAKTVGFSFDFRRVEDNRFLGGVISKEDALKLANFIIQNVK